MSVVACFVLVPTTRAARGLRRYTYSSDAGIPPCVTGYGHDATAPIGVVDCHIDADGCQALDDPRDGELHHFANDPRWPTVCARCGWTFDRASGGAIQDQLSWHLLYRRADGRPIGDAGLLEVTLRDAPAGAMYFADWYQDVAEWIGPDGRALIVVLPPDGHPWHIDGRASNCDSPCASCGQPYHAHNQAAADRAFKCDRYRDARPHKCWVRHGEPPNVTVDKQGITCGAGAGSIQTKRYHGFLQGGRLVQS